MKCNSISNSSLLVLSLLLAVTGAHAQSAARANVPFAFKVGTTQMPAGTYSIRNEIGTNVGMVSNVQTGTSALARGHRFAGISPTERVGRRVVEVFKERFQFVFEVGNRGEVAATHHLSHHDPEDHFDRVQP